METNNLTIIPPEGMEAYQEGNEIKFRPVKKELTYKDIARELFDNKIIYHIADGRIVESLVLPNTYYNTNNCTSNKQAEKLLAINKLMNVAKYLNGDWQPDWNNNYENKYYLRIYNEKIEISYAGVYISDIVYFKSEEFAKQAIKILGEEIIKLALSTDW